MAEVESLQKIVSHCKEYGFIFPSSEIYDNLGAVTTSTAVTVVVKKTNVAPSVSITSPTNNASFSMPASMTINATAADTDGTIAKVDFYRGTTLLFSDNAAP